MQTYIFRRPTFGGRFLCPAVSVLRPAVYGRQNFPRAALRAYFSPTLYRPRLRPILLRTVFVPFSLVQPCAAAHGGRFAPLALRAAEFFCSLSLQGGRIFTYYSTSAAERQSYLPAKFVSPQNAPFRTQTAFAFFTEEAFCTARAGVKNISSPPRPSAAGGAGHSAPSTLVVPCACALRRGVRTSTCSACKMRLFLHIFPMQGIKLPSTGQTIGEDPNGCAAELHMMI